MEPTRSFLRCYLLIPVGCALMLPVGASAPNLISYQGQLIDDAGAPITSTTTIRFTLLWGGSPTENPSTGTPVYQEDVQVTPDPSGVFQHLIGAGSTTSGCDEDRDGMASESCALLPDDFPDSTTVVYLELRIDPSGSDNLLLPRQRIASVGYAMNADTVDGQGAATLIAKAHRPGYRYDPTDPSQVLVSASPGTPIVLGIEDEVLRSESSLVLDLDTLGPGGLDSGPKAADTIYYMYATNAGGLPQLIASTLDPETGPSGYPEWTYVGAFLTDSAADVAPFFKEGDWLYFADGDDGQLQFLTDGAATTPTAVAIPKPTTVRVVRILSILEPGGQETGELRVIWGLVPNTGTSRAWFRHRQFVSVATGRWDTRIVDLPIVDSANQVWYYLTPALAGAGVHGRVIGWLEDPTRYQ